MNGVVKNDIDKIMKSIKQNNLAINDNRHLDRCSLQA